MKSPDNLYLLLMLAIACSVSSCVKDEYELNKMTFKNYTPEIAIPLVHSKFDVVDILTFSENQAANSNNNLDVAADGLMIFIYNDTLFSEKASDFITFPPLTPSLIKDYAGSDTLQLAVDSIDLNLEVYNKLIGGKFYFEDPVMLIKVANSFGIPINLTLTTFQTWSPINGTTIIELFSMPPPIALTPPPAFPLTQGDIAYTTYTFDKSNSNIKTFLETTPKYIYYAVQGITNVPPPLSNFITASSEFSVEVEIQLPLHGYAEFLSLGDTLPFSLGINSPSGTDLSVESAVFVVNTYNGFPIDVALQLFFVNSSGIVVDSLYYTGAETVIRSGLVGPAPGLRVYSPTHTVTEITVDRARLDRIGSATQLIIRGTLTSTNVPQLVKVYDDYTIEIKLAVRAKLFSRS